MRLREVFGGVAPDAAAESRSRRSPTTTAALQPGTVFFCVRGFTRDGHDFAADAVARGAVALVVDHPLGLGVPEVVVADVRAAMAPAAARLHGDPTAALRTIGVTGTNGKTTTAYLVRALLEAAGEPTGLLGTVTPVIGGAEHEVARTTPEAIDLQATFAAMRAAGDTHCVMEVSSHALALGRADAIHWAAAIFTNLTQDHLDFHATMEDYFAANAGFLSRAGRTSPSSTSTIPTARGSRRAARDAATRSASSSRSASTPRRRLRATDIHAASTARRSSPAASSCARRCPAASTS